MSVKELAVPDMSEQMVRMYPDLDLAHAIKEANTRVSQLHLQVKQMAETDPNGLALNVPGAKADAGKQRPALMLSGFANALSRVAEVTTKGAAKYSPNGWMHVDNGIERYQDAGYRHQLSLWQGEKIDSDTSCDHEAQVIWNMLASYELKLRKELQNKKLDDDHNTQTLHAI